MGDSLLHAGPASLPWHVNCALARGFQTEPCQGTHGPGSHKGSTAVVSPEEDGR